LFFYFYFTYRSFCHWLKPSSAAVGAGQAPVFTQGLNSAGRCAPLGNINNLIGGTAFYNGGYNFQIFDNGNIIKTYLPTANQWFHVCHGIDSAVSPTFNTYINGQLYDSSTNSLLATFLAISNDWYFGSSNAVGTPPNGAAVYMVVTLERNKIKFPHHLYFLSYHVTN
jgi:hypothetical protein